jgi:pimeloyl-ACP methyl ester carboxylesterase
MKRLIDAAVALAFVGTLFLGGSVQAAGSGPIKNVVLVHGAFADASSWSKVIPLLQKKGLHVTAVSNPLTSFSDDVAATRRAIAAQDGPVILVGHSYGGVVITQAGDDPKVAGLVYVAAYAPDAGQAIGEMGAEFPKPLGLTKLGPVGDGFLMLSPEGIETAFAQDLSKPEQALLVAVQAQTSGTIIGAKPTVAAWKSKPSWYIVSANDRMIVPDHERSMAKQMKAKTTELASSHVAMLSHPKEVADIILDAVSNARK